MIKSFFLLLWSVLTCVFIQAQEPMSYESNPSDAGSFNLRSNTLSWLLLIPNLGIEYKPSEQIGLLLEGNLAHWNFAKKGNDHYWHHWNVSPAVRYYMNEQRDVYLAVQGQLGAYNIGNEQAKYYSGGLGFGKQYYVSKKMQLDLGLTFGYLRREELEKIKQVNGVFYRRGAVENKGYWGPTQVQVSFIRKLN